MCLFVRLLPLDLSGMGDPTSSYATAGIALTVSGALKPHHHDKVETPSVGRLPVIRRNILPPSPGKNWEIYATILLGVIS
jgi:hypothetical protein